MIDLSIIIISYNTATLTKKCIETIYSSLSKSDVKTEIILFDNNSSDKTIEIVLKNKSQKTKYKQITNNKYQITNNIQLKIIKNKTNIGFARGNNRAVKQAKGKYILLLNSDTQIDDIDFNQLLNYMTNNKDVAILTVKVVFPDGSIDPASHRGFPTIWRSFCYYSKLEKIFTLVPYLNNFFGGYHLVGKNLKKLHKIDSPSGAFMLIVKKIFDQVGGFDEKFFMYGEDLDLSMRIKKLGYIIIYYPKYQVIHFKHQSGLKHKSNHTQNNTRYHFYNAMKIFYQKHYSTQYPNSINRLIYFIIDLKSKW